MTHRDFYTGKFITAEQAARDAMSMPHSEPVSPSAAYVARQYDAHSPDDVLSRSPFPGLMSQEELDAERRWPAGWWILPAVVLGFLFWVVVAWGILEVI